MSVFCLFVRFQAFSVKKFGISWLKKHKSIKCVLNIKQIYYFLRLWSGDCGGESENHMLSSFLSSLFNSSTMFIFVEALKFNRPVALEKIQLNGRVLLKSCATSISFPKFQCKNRHNSKIYKLKKMFYVPFQRPFISKLFENNIIIVMFHVSRDLGVHKTDSIVGISFIYF